MGDGPSARGGRPWRPGGGTPLVVLLCGGLFVASAENSEGTDLRAGRYTDLASLVSSEASGTTAACSSQVSDPQRPRWPR